MLPESMLIRAGEPSKYDQSPYGTLCKKVKTLNDNFEIYIQTSKDDCNPCWEKIGVFSQKTERLILKEVARILSIKKTT